jgi:hypothetical protein
MSTVASTSTSRPDFASIFDAALERYKLKTKKDLASHPLLSSLPSQYCASPQAILSAFPTLDKIDGTFTRWVIPTINILHTFSGIIGQVAGLVNIIYPYKEYLL